MKFIEKWKLNWKNMKKILDINYSKINHMEKLLLDSDFYNRYKIGAVIKYGAV